MSLESAYHGKSVVVTGGASFIGSHLCERLVRLGANVTVIDDLSSGRLENLASIAQEIQFHSYDLRADSSAAALFRGQSIIFHLAAIHGGRGFVDTRGVDCLSNLRIDNVLLDAAVGSDIEKVVFASSACVYPVTLQAEPSLGYLLKESDAGFTRPDQAFPDGIYGWTKLMGELQLKTYHEAHKLTGVACRLFSIYGPRQTASHSVAAVIGRALRREEPFHIWGPGSQTRNFTHVLDAVSGLLRAGCLTSYATVNIGLEQAVEVDALAQAIFGEVKWRPTSIVHDTTKPVGVFHRASDNSVAARLLSWSPSITLDDGLLDTMSWYQHHEPMDLTERGLFAQG